MSQISPHQQFASELPPAKPKYPADSSSDLPLLPQGWRTKLTRFFPRRPKPQARLEQLFLIHRPTGAILQHALRQAENPHDMHARDECRAIASMVTYLLAYLRDPRHLAHYLHMRSLRIEHFTYGIHAVESCILLSVIRTIRRADTSGIFTLCQDILDGIQQSHGDILQTLDEHPEIQLPPLLPAL